MTGNGLAEQGLRERKKQETRIRLIEAAFALFEERGFDQVSAAEIADSAGVSERTFFRYFPSKEEVIFPDADEQRRHVDDLVANLPQDVPLIEGLRGALRAISHEYEESKDLQLRRARLVVATPSVQTLILRREQEWVESFANAVAERLDVDVATDPRPELTAAVVVAVFRVVLSRWIRAGGEGDMSQMLDQALAYVGTGLVAKDR